MTDDRIEKIRAEVERLKESGCASPIVICDTLLSFIDSMEEEPKKCMYSKDDFTDEDRKVLCDGCEEACKYAQKEEPVSEELEEVAKRYATEGDEISGLYIIDEEVDAFKAGANWQKEQTMKSAVERIVKVDAGGYPYILEMELYDYDKDIPLAKEGDKYKVILIKAE